MSSLGFKMGGGWVGGRWFNTRENVDSQDPAEDEARGPYRDVEQRSGYCQVSVWKHKIFNKYIIIILI